MNLKSLYNKLEKIRVHTEDKETFANILAEIQSEIITNGKINKGIISNYKKFIKPNTEARPIFNQVYKSKKNSYCICNGHGLIDYGTDLNNVPKELISYIDLMKDYERPNFDYVSLKNNIEELKEYKIKISDLIKVSNYNKIIKNNLLPYNFDNMFINADYLLQLLSLAEYKSDTVTVLYSNNKSPLHIELENCNILLLPISVNNNYEEFKEKCKEILDMKGV